MGSFPFPAPHGDKLKALVSNDKLPAGDLVRVEAQLARYHAWVAEMEAVTAETAGSAGRALLESLVAGLNRYKKSVEFDLIFCSAEDFLYRQKGQLKLDNTILEEFLPRLFDARLVPGLSRAEGLVCGPRGSFAGLSFSSPLLALSSGGVYLKRKDQDFSVTRKHNLTISRPDASGDIFSEDFYVSYFAAEVKTNLDKTMFQEASATASELKKATSGSRYILLCEWLDMVPVSTQLTAIDEVIILRRSRRIEAGIRKDFSTARGRQARAGWFESFLDSHPLSLEGFERFVFHLNACFPDAGHDTEAMVLDRGFF